METIIAVTLVLHAMAQVALTILFLLLVIVCCGAGMQFLNCARRYVEAAGPRDLVPARHDIRLLSDELSTGARGALRLVAGHRVQHGIICFALFHLRFQIVMRRAQVTEHVALAATLVELCELL